MKQLTYDDMMTVIDDMPQDVLYLNEYLMSFMDFCADREYVPDGKIISGRLSMMI